MVEVAATHYQSASWRLVGVCVHEAAHAVVASDLGCDAQIRVERTPVGLAGWCNFTGPHRYRADRAVALAGEIGEHLAVYGRWAPDRELHARLSRTAFMSDSDRILAGRFTVADIDACSGRVRAAWPRVVSVTGEVLERFLGSLQ
jgi:hypothetical protein